MTTALVTGARGLIGRQLAARLAITHRVVALGHTDLDVTDPAAVRGVVAHVRPALIVNGAVLQVDECERDPARAEEVNVDGPRLLAEQAEAVGAELVHFSTNYVFDGEPIGRPPYTADDPPRPLNVYGRTKLAGEQAVRAACAQSLVIRTSWVFGPGKQSFVGTVHQRLRDGVPVRAVGDVWASATFVDDLVARTLALLARHTYGVFHVVNAGVCSHLAFAREAARLVGLDEERATTLVSAVRDADQPRLARRPRYTPLRGDTVDALGLAPLRDWRAALAVHVGR